MNPISKLEETKEQQVDRILKLFYSLFYYLIITIINYFVISTFQSDCLPTFFNGSLNLTSYTENWPRDVNPYVKYVFLFSIGHHVERTVELLMDYKKMNFWTCLLYTSPSPRDLSTSRMPSSA